MNDLMIYPIAKWEVDNFNNHGCHNKRGDVQLPQSGIMDQFSGSILMNSMVGSVT